jgi:hypothetical protein
MDGGFNSEQESARPAPVPQWASRLPGIDYAAHPAYAEWVRSATLRGRMRALRTFARGMATALARWAVDAEHLPKPPDGVGRARWFASQWRPIGRAVARGWRFRAFPRAARGPTHEGRACADALGAEGMMLLKLSNEERTIMARFLAPHFDRLEERLARIPEGARHFDDNRYWVAPAADPALYAWFEEMLEARGMLSGSSAHLRRPVRVAHLVPQINRPENDFWSARFGDIGLPDSRCNYCHVDTAHNTTKMIVYISEVGPENGPFSYVAGSHRTRRDFWDRMIRRAVDHSGIGASDPRSRALFAALPAVFRRKGAFGQDLADDHPAAAPILAGERAVTSDLADGILFDPVGVHRGGMVRSGERRIVGVVLAGR